MSSFVKILYLDGISSLLFLLVNDFCIDLSGLDISMTKHFTDSIDVCTIGQL